MATTDSRMAIVNIDQLTEAQAETAINAEIEVLETAGFVVREQKVVSLGPAQSPKTFVLLLALLATHLDAAVPNVQSAEVTLVAGTATESTLTYTASSQVIPIRNTGAGTEGDLSVGTITPGAPGSAVIDSANGADTSTVTVLVIG